MDWYLSALNRFDDFSGRSRRQEYWMFLLFNVVVIWTLIIIENAVGISSLKDDSYEPGIIVTLYCFFAFLPGLAVAVRRFHDVGKSGWFLLVSLIPIVGPIWCWILMITDGQPGSNKYGQNPKELAPASTTVLQSSAPVYGNGPEITNEIHSSAEIQEELDSIKFKYAPLNETASKLSSDIVAFAMEARKAQIMKRFAEPLDNAAAYQVFSEFMFFYLYQLDKSATLLLSFQNKSQLLNYVWCAIVDEIISNSLITLDKKQLETDLMKGYETARSHYELYESSQREIPTPDNTIYLEFGHRLLNNISYLINTEAVTDLALTTVEKLQYTRRILKLANAWN